MRKKLEFQADRIEELLRSHNVAGYVAGGTVTPCRVCFEVLPAKGTRVSAIKRLSDDIAVALGVPDLRVQRRGATLTVEVPREDPKSIQLMSLLRQLDVDRIPPVTAVLGLSDDGAPLLIRLPSPDVAHVLIAGTTGSGKTVLLRAMVLSLSLRHPQPHELALVLIDPRGGRAFECLSTLPHLPRPVVGKAEDAGEALGSLVRLMDRRDQGTDPGPPIVVVIDELADLLMTTNGTAEHLTRLVQRGRGAGIHVVAATQKPTAEVLGPLVKANFPARLVGKVTSATDARVASGWSGTGAERLQGRGDFIAVAEGRVMRFQGAYISPEGIGDVLGDKAWDKSLFTKRQGRSVQTEMSCLSAPPKAERELDPVAELVDRLQLMKWNPGRSYRAACRALGMVEGGEPFYQVREAVDRLRDRATATTEECVKLSRGGEQAVPASSSSTVASWAENRLAYDE
ncbi:MAG: DNA translocase FtsK [bacterium]